MAKKILYFGIGSLVTLSALFFYFSTNQDFKFNPSENISCAGACINPDDTDCIEPFNITSLKNISLKNKGNINMEFSEPNKVRSFKIEKYFSTWRDINFSKSQTFKAGVVNQYRLKICKNIPNDSIKWGLSGIVQEDPIFFGIDKCGINQKKEDMHVYEEEIIYYNTTLCSDFPINKSCVISPLFNYTRKIHTEWTTICVDKIE